MVEALSQLEHEQLEHSSHPEQQAEHVESLPPMLRMSEETLSFQ